MTREEQAADVVLALRAPRWRSIICTDHYNEDDNTWTVALDCGHNAVVGKYDEGPTNMANCLECE